MSERDAGAQNCRDAVAGDWAEAALSEQERAQQSRGARQGSGWREGRAGKTVCNGGQRRGRRLEQIFVTILSQDPLEGSITMTHLCVITGHISAQ